ADPRRTPAPIPVGPAGPLPGEGQGAPGRDRGPVDRHAGRPRAALGAGSACGSGRRARLSRDAGNRAAAGGGSGPAGPRPPPPPPPPPPGAPPPPPEADSPTA